MHYKYVIKLMKVEKGKKKSAFSVVVTDNKHKINGFFIEHLGIYNLNGNTREGFIDLKRFGFWVNKGAFVSSKVKWIVSLIVKGE